MFFSSGQIIFDVGCRTGSSSERYHSSESDAAEFTRGVAIDGNAAENVLGQSRRLRQWQPLRSY
jgi:hypothetical protein